MSKRAYSPKDIERKKYESLEWDEKWSGPFGCPAVNEMWFISGSSAGGKSSFAMQLAKKLCEVGPTLYLSYEEQISQSFQERIERFKMNDVQGRFRVATDDSYEELVARLEKQKSPHFIIVDSFQVAEWTYKQAKDLKDRFPTKSFIYISQEYKGQPSGKSANRLRYLAGVKIRVAGYKAYCMGRFTGEPGSYYPVWEEGIIKVNNKV